MPSSDNWAIVIGINDYWDADSCLQGAVNDALKMRTWLLDPDGGNVPSDQLFLFLAPQDPSLPNCYFAEKSELINVITTLVTTKNVQGKRLFFYYSGHGIADPQSPTLETALIPADFEPTAARVDRAFRLDELLEYFQGSGFEDQFVFVDACRNIPAWGLQSSFVLGSWTIKPHVDPNLPPVQQFVFYATSPGVEATEQQEAGNERGAFTDALLEGLKNGKSRAKTYDSASTDYLVKVDSLFDFVKSEVSKLQATLTNPALRLLQVPQLKGQRGTAARESNPELARFPEGTFGKERLEVGVTPITVVPGVNIAAKRDGKDVETAPNAQALPVIWDLPQREYSVCADAANYERQEKQWPTVALYEPQTVTVMLAPKPPASSSGSPGGAPPTSATTGGSVSGASGSAQLVASSSDMLAPLEVTDSTGTLLGVGQGRLTMPDLPPGFYRLRLRSPEGQVVEQLIQLSAGDSESLTLDAPSVPDTRLTREVIRKASFDILSDKTLTVSESIGPMASAQLSTILALVGSVANGTAEFHAPRLRSLGLTPFKETFPWGGEIGVQLLFAVDTPTSEEAIDYLSRVKVGLLRHKSSFEPMPSVTYSPTAFSQIAGLGQLAISAPPGHYRLELALPGKKSFVSELPILQDRLSMVVISREPNDRVHIFQYLPGLTPADSLEPNRVRQLELFQRFYLSGQFIHAAQNIGQILEGQWDDPIAGCLAGYLLLRRGDAQFLGILDQALTSRYYSKLSDSYVLKAEYETYRGNEEGARATYYNALEEGLPMFADGLMWLLDGVRRYQIEHPLVNELTSLIPRRVHGMLWSAWYSDNAPSS